MTFKDGILYTIPTIKNNRYIYLFIFFVLCDVITTYLMYDNIPYFEDLNPNIHYLRTLIPNLALFYIVFTIIKLWTLEIILLLLDILSECFNNIYEGTGYIYYIAGYITVLVMSIYIFINNLGVLGYV